MVVSRKTPAAPTQAVSRTSSSQPISRAAKAKAINHVDQPQPSQAEPMPRKETTESLSQRKGKTSRISEPRQTHSLLNRLFKFALVLFAVYAYTVCPTDHPRSSLVCRSLDTYRANILDPYIMPPILTYVVPPIQSALHHPKVALLHPYVEKAATFEREKVRPRVAALTAQAEHQYETRVLPAFNKHIKVALWQRRVLPTYRSRVHPHLKPYIAYYKRDVAPRIRRTADAAHDVYERALLLYRRAEPHIFRVISTSRKYACVAYNKAKPVAITVWAHAKPHLLRAADHAQLYMLKLSAIIGDARRQYVDPHVRRIWEKVAEADTASVAGTGTTIAEPEEEVTITSTVTWTKHDPQPTETYEEVAPDSASSVILESVNTVAAQSGVVSEILDSLSEAIQHTPAVEESTSAAQAFGESSSIEPEHDPRPTPTILEEIKSTPVSVSTHINIIPSAAAATNPDSAEEVDDFLRDLGLDEQVVDTQQGESGGPPNDTQEKHTEEHTQQQQQQPVMTEEQRKAETAAKRADIVARHVVWQEKLDKLVEEKEAEVRASLVKFRQEVVKGLDELFTVDGNGSTEGVIPDVEREAGKLLRGLEAFLRKNGETSTSQLANSPPFSSIVAKVEQKFNDKVHSARSIVHAYYVQAREQEIEDVLKAAEENVKALAERAQADLGLDYAWLDDVTYHDWQKYHDLMRTSERFNDRLRSIQNGTHAVPVPDPFLDTLNELEVEMQDVIAGFKYRLKGIMERVEAQQQQAQQTSSASEEPSVTIHPMPVVPPFTDNAPEPSIPVVGRSEEEVIDRLRNIPTVPVEERYQDEL